MAAPHESTLVNDIDSTVEEAARASSALPLGHLSLVEIVPDNPEVLRETEVVEGVALRNTKTYAGYLLKTPLQEADAPAFWGFMEAFGFPLYRARRASTGHQTETAEPRIREARLYLRGLSNIAIQQEVSATSAATVGVRRLLAARSLASYYSPEAMDKLFEDYCAGIPLPDPTTVIKPRRSTAEAQKASQTTGKVATPTVVNAPDLDTPAIVQERGEPDWEQGIIDTCATFWSETDIDSLRALLTSKDGEAVQAARNHLTTLMAVNAHMRPGQGKAETETMPLIQWETLSYLIGYNLPQGQKTLTANGVAMRLFQKYERKNTSFEETLATGITTLIKRASKDYERGWYPTTQQFDTYEEVNDEAEKAPPSQAEVEAAHLQNIRGVLGRLIRKRESKEGMVDLMAEHFVGHKVATESALFVRGSTALRSRLVESIRRARSHANNGGATKRDITTREVQLLESMLTNNLTFSDPKTFDKILEARKQMKPGFSAEDLHEEILSSLRRLATTY